MPLRVLSLTLILATGARADDWPQFRGPGGAGVVSGKVLPPDRWTTTENVAWKADIPGQGWSGPIVTGGKVFVTSCVSADKVVAPKTGYYAPKDTKTLPGEHRWTLFCLDAATGKVLWEKVAHKGPPKHPIHVKGSYAPETPVTDGERVYAYFGNVGVFCYDLAGKQLWSRSWDVVPTQLDWGTGASPVLHKDRLYIVNDNEKSSFLVALDTKTGAEVWKAERAEKSNWATPFVWESGTRTEIVTSGKGKVRSYGLDGKLLWEFGGMSSICVPAPIAAHGLLIVSSGYEFGRPRPVFAVRPEATGDISLKKGETSNEFIAWYKEPAGAYHPTPLVLGDYLYVLYSTGFIACFDAKTGKPVYERERLGGSFTASPWAYDGKIFCLSEEGVTSVVKAGPKFELVGKNDLGEVALATPAVADGRLFVRTTSKLYCIAKAEGKTGEQPAKAVRPDDISLKKLPLDSSGPNSYHVDPFIAIAGKLQAAGKEKAAAILRAADEDPEIDDITVIYFCRMLFTAKPKGAFRRPLIGGPNCLGGTEAEDWSLEPIEVVDGVPFVVITGYTLAGSPESPKQYLDYCLKECDWGTTEFKPRTAAEKKKALEKLLASKKWKEPLTDWEKEFLTAQIR